MNVKELLLEIEDFGKIHDTYINKYPLFEDYEIAAMTKEKVNEINIHFFNYLQSFFSKLKDINIITDSKEVIFITKLKDTNMDSPEYIYSWSCYKEEINEKIKDEFTLWNDNGNRIEHYCYDSTNLKEILAFEVFYKDVTKEEAVCEILHELIRWGIDDNERNENIEKFHKSIEESIKDIDSSETIDADTFFEELEKEILEGASEEEKEKILTKRKLKEKNKDRDELYRSIVMRLNHKKCISIIEEYFLEKLKN